MHILPSKTAFACFKDVFVYLSYIWLFKGLIWPFLLITTFSRVDLAFFASDYLAILVSIINASNFSRREKTSLLRQDYSHMLRNGSSNIWKMSLWGFRKPKLRAHEKTCSIWKFRRPRPVQLVFPIRDKMLKPGFRVVEKRNPGKPVISDFEMNAILSDKNSISLWITTVGPCAIY